MATTLSTINPTTSSPASAAQQEYAAARKEMNELMASHRMIEKKLHASLASIQQIHQLNGAEYAKIVGSLAVQVLERRGKISDTHSNTVIKVAVEPEDAMSIVEETPPIQWLDASSFPVTLEFERILSREAIIRVTVEKEGEDADPVHEIQIPISTLFNAPVDSWYPLKDLPALGEENTKVIDDGPSTSTEDSFAVSQKANEMTEPVPGVKEVEVVSESIAEDIAETEVEAEEEEEEKFVDAVAEEEAVIASYSDNAPEEEELAIKISATFMLSEIEQLAKNVIELSKIKSELERARQFAERKLTHARVNFERFQAATRADQKSIKQALAAENQTWMQRSMARFNAIFTPQRKETIKNVSIFVGSVLLFHYQGENFAV